jgi:hypothetical protein
METMKNLLFCLVLLSGTLSAQKPTMYTIYFSEPTQLIDPKDTTSKMMVYEYAKVKVKHWEEDVNIIVRTATKTDTITIDYRPGITERLCFYKDGKLKYAVE